MAPLPTYEELSRRVEELQRQTRFHEKIARVEGAIQASGRVEETLGNALEAVREIFSCDRTWLFTPCSPDAAEFSVMVQSTGPGTPGDSARGRTFPMTADMADCCRRALAAGNRVITDPPTDQAIASDMAHRFSVRSHIFMALHPNIGGAWMFGLHQCRCGRVWSAEEKQLFEHIGSRVTDALNTLLYVRQLKASEAGLARKRDALKSIIDNNPHGIAVIDKAGNWIYVNPMFEQITGYTLKELPTGKAWFQKAYPDPAYRQRVIAAWAADRTRPEKGDDFEFEVTCKDGQVKQIEFRTTYLEDRSISVLTDVTQRKQAQEALTASRERYRGLSDAALEAVFISEKGVCIDTNQTASDMFGCSREELIGIFGTDVIAPESKEIVRQNMLSGYEKPYEAIAQKKDGTRFYVEIRGKMTEYTGRQVRVTVVHDIDERKKAEKALRQSEEKYRQLVEHANDAILIIQDEVIRFFNPRAIQLIGYTADESAELPISAFIHPDDRSDVLDRYRRRVAGENLPSTYNCRLTTRQGKTIWVQINAVRTMWDERPATLTFMRDITHLKTIEARLQQVEKMEAIGTLAGGIAHDFNNILASIIGYCELALEDVKKGSLLEENLNEVFKAGKRAKDLVQQILTFARRSADRMEPVVVSLVATEALKLLRATLPATIEIRLNIESESTVMADPSRIQQLFINLCTNAAQAMEEKGGVLSVRITDMRLDLPVAGSPGDLAAGDYLKVTVADTGTGIPQQHLRSIYDPYFTTKGTGRGTGLGLAVVHGIVKSYGGDITVKSRVGSGTAFTLYLPISHQHPPVAMESPGDFPAGHEHILFVDDEAAIVKMNTQLLSSLGYHVTARTSSLEALELFRATPETFDLVITDMTMPKMTGDRLAAEMMKIRPDIPVILCTGYSAKISDGFLRKVGVKAVAYKPLVKRDLAHTIREALDGGEGPNG